MPTYEMKSLPWYCVNCGEEFEKIEQLARHNCKPKKKNGKKNTN